MKQILLIIFFSFSLIISCQNKKQVDNSAYGNKTNTVNVEIKKDTMQDLNIAAMKGMLDKEYELIDGNKPSDYKAIQWTNSETFKALLKSGYKTPTPEEFQLKMQNVFGINMQDKQTCKWDKKDGKNIIIYGKQYIEDEKKGFNSEFRSEYFESDYTGNILFFCNKQFMSFIISPVRIVNFSEDSLSYKVKIPQYIISRNKYLFNDDQSQFSWLINNDEDFMESLVTTFGYTKDQKLLKWVMEKNYSKAGDFVKNNVFVKDCKGNLEIREDILKYIEETTNDQERNYAMQLLYLSDREDWPDFSEEQYFKIIAYMANTFDPLTEKYANVGLQSSAKWSILGGLHYEMEMYDKNGVIIRDIPFTGKDWRKMLSEFKKNNYYNLPNLQLALKIAENY